MASSLGLKNTQVKSLIDIANNNIVYKDNVSSVYKDETLQSLPSILDIEGVIQVYDKQAPFINAESTGIDRPSKYFIPDAVYNVMYTIKELKEERETLDRKDLENLTAEVRDNITFYEAVLVYLGYNKDIVNSFSSMYMDIINSKDKGEYVVEYINGEYKVIDKFNSILEKYNIPNDRNIAILLSYDNTLVNSNNSLQIQDKLNIPFEVGITTRENLVLASTCLTGKVRYVWGGGHGGTANIIGINPMWFSFNELYNGKNGCLQPSKAYCPIHNTSRNDSLSDKTVSSIEEYLILREPYIRGTSTYNLVMSDYFKETFKNTKFNVPAHRLDGLDCSGFISWVYNQIDTTRRYDSTAKDFVKSSNFEELAIGDKLLAGDVIAWDTHICMVVGAVSDRNDVYTIIEATPDTVMFGTAYYKTANERDIQLARKIARESNSLWGDLDKTGNIYDIDDLDYVYRETVEPVDTLLSIEEYTEDSLQAEETAEDSLLVVYGGISIGRLKRGFEEHTIEDMYSVDILQHTLDNTPIEYLKGVDSYKGDLFKIQR